MKLECSEWNGLFLHPRGKHSNIHYVSRLFAEFAKYNCLEWLLNSLAKCNCSLDLLQIVFQNNDPEAKQHHPPPYTTLHMCCIWFSFAALSSRNVDARLTNPPSLQWSQETQWASGCDISKNDVLVFACQVQVQHVPGLCLFFLNLDWNEF